MAKELLHVQVVSLESDVADTVNELFAEQGKTIGVFCAELLTLDALLRKERGCGLVELVEQAQRRVDFWKAHAMDVADESGDEIGARAARTGRF
mgnify:CR=1 FL=1